MTHHMALQQTEDSHLLSTFKAFLKDTEAAEMYITGVAGTGKTTALAELIRYCISYKLYCVTTAYTHKAVKVLYNKLPKPGEYADICTLHSYLKKHPTINGSALKLAHVDGNAQTALPKKVDVIFVDEFSMIGEQDYMSIGELQYDEEGEVVITKVVYIGDPNQLPPVKDIQTIIPKKPYWVQLTKIHRQKDDNPLIETLMALNDYINGIEVNALKEHATFKRGKDIVNLYLNCNTSKILLAYTNEKVQSLNAEVQGREEPLVGDTVFSPTTRFMYTLASLSLTSPAIVSVRGSIIELDSKFKTLETLHEIKEVQFMTLADEEGREMPRACVFGHSTFLKLQQELASKAVALNKQISTKFGQDPKVWAQANRGHELAVARAKAWTNFLAFKDCVLCVDFAHAMTVHKSQGSTYENVFIDIEDIGKCANSDYKLYLKLLYVAISRASHNVYTN